MKQKERHSSKDKARSRNRLGEGVSDVKKDRQNQLPTALKKHHNMLQTDDPHLGQKSLKLFLVNSKALSPKAVIQSP